MVKFRLASEHHHVGGGPLLHTEKPDDHVCDLHARIVDVVLNLHACTRMPQDANHGVAEYRVSHVPDVRRFVRIDAGVLDEDFLVRAFRCSTSRACLPLRPLPKCATVEVGVQVSAASDLHARDTFDLTQGGSDFLGHLPRSFFQQLGQLKTHYRRRLAHIELGRAIQHNLKLHAVLFTYV